MYTRVDVNDNKVGDRLQSHFKEAVLKSSTQESVFYIYHLIQTVRIEIISYDNKFGKMDARSLSSLYQPFASNWPFISSV